VGRRSSLTRNKVENGFQACPSATPRRQETTTAGLSLHLHGVAEWPVEEREQRKNEKPPSLRSGSKDSGGPAGRLTQVSSVLDVETMSTEEIMNSFAEMGRCVRSPWTVFSLDGPEWVVKPRCVSSFCSLLREAGRYSARLLRLCTITVFIH
jgi:hypothetical protein